MRGGFKVKPQRVWAFCQIRQRFFQWNIFDEFTFVIVYPDGIPVTDDGLSGFIFSREDELMQAIQFYPGVGDRALFTQKGQRKMERMLWIFIFKFPF